MNDKYESIKKILIKELSSSSHDINHVMRVYKTSLELARHEQDADKLDVLGTVGIARLYIIAGKHNQKIYSDVLIDEYIKENIIDNGRINDGSKHSPDIEYELKLKKIPDRLFTRKAKEIAINRLEYMETFFNEIRNNIV
ncbi:hypothetical protein RBU61_13410 [Tissierella sp. MB52-C2]|uniref:hypothetical protein n=1 Tax=Tissierella sp. MB52-C2 TaxID=3070999 RepID=UPI00280ACCAC|nr:hypothetical protein [Tissierella sp. MB52-C2]WMM23915.1 hypothetical protein RBU61_13410 [Tissierella sp. MB52-C2]